MKNNKEEQKVNPDLIKKWEATGFLKGLTLSNENLSWVMSNPEQEIKLTIKSDLTKFQEIVKLSEVTPNDMELGTIIRKFINEYKKKENE